MYFNRFVFRDQSNRDQLCTDVVYYERCKSIIKNYLTKKKEYSEVIGRCQREDLKQI